MLLGALAVARPVIVVVVIIIAIVMMVLLRRAADRLDRVDDRVGPGEPHERPECDPEDERAQVMELYERRGIAD